VLWDIESDPALAGVKLIAEPWDAKGLYDVGRFIGDSWREWNGPFRDDVRSFVRGDDCSVGALADRLMGSPQIYGHKQQDAEESVNFVTCHDGFTLNDLVSYDHKYNQANGESNRDGMKDFDNRSWNCGFEGPTDDPVIERLRNRQIKNFFTATLLSVGVPMFVMGDEVRRSQRGNNNAYCQDNDTSWFDWTLLSKHADVLRFVQLLIELRVMRDMEHERRRVSLSQVPREVKRTWHGVKLNQPDWSPGSHSLAVGVDLKNEGLGMYLILNAYWEALDFELPVLRDGRENWRGWIDTALDPPHDICKWNKAAPVLGGTYRAGARSVVVLIAGEAVNGGHFH